MLKRIISIITCAKSIITASMPGFFSLCSYINLSTEISVDSTAGIKITHPKMRLITAYASSLLVRHEFPLLKTRWWFACCLLRGAGFPSLPRVCRV